MTTWLIFGAAKGTGALMVQRAVESQQPVIAFVRKADDAKKLEAQGVSVVVGDACNPCDVAKACESAGSDSVIISTIGGSQDYPAHRTIIDCAEKQNISQMVMVTSLGCGDTWPTLSDRAKAAFGQAVREKTLAEVWLQTSKLTYCILRPGGLLNGEATGKAQLYENQEVHGFVKRSDIVVTIEKLIALGLNNKAYSLVEPGLAPQASR